MSSYIDHLWNDGIVQFHVQCFRPKTPVFFVKKKSRIGRYPPFLICFFGQKGVTEFGIPQPLQIIHIIIDHTLQHHPILSPIRWVKYLQILSPIWWVKEFPGRFASLRSRLSNNDDWGDMACFSWHFSIFIQIHFILSLYRFLELTGWVTIIIWATWPVFPDVSKYSI